jgi:hypothetical protein
MMAMPRSPQEIIDAIVAEASQDSWGEPKNPAHYRADERIFGADSTFHSWHNNAQREYLYDLAMELAASTLAEQANAH